MAPATNIGVFNLFVMVLVDYAVGLALGMLIHLLLFDCFFALDTERAVSRRML